MGERKKISKKSIGSKIAFSELKREKFEKKAVNFLLLVTAISGFILLIFLFNSLSLTGYSNYVDSQAGDITELTLYRKFDTSYWAGAYGLALRVSDFTELLSGTFSEGEIKRQDIFFDCLQADAVGGPEVYASTSPEVDFDNLIAGDPVKVDSYLGCSGKTECATNTFIKTMNLMVGSRNITDIPSTHTYRFDGENEVFDLGLLEDGENFVYVAHVKNIQPSYDEEKLVIFQMILPVLPGESFEYYFFTDPYDVCPEGGIGNNLAVQLYGYVFDMFGEPIENASVIVAGFESRSNSEGYYA
ncbi:MAG TPA: hypothetical protein VJ895_00150, partial [Candidatus Nanoarchaeia archaeon]|nr:hypothetical protein [Candidatus Nanoarchaeia archaeon]